MVKAANQPMLAAPLGNFHIVPEFSANISATQRVVIQQAINEWEALIQTRGFTAPNYPISFTNVPPLAILALADCYNSLDQGTGNLISAAIRINDAVNWYVDPAPWDDMEFATPPLPEGTDLLSVMRHEIGHAVGWDALSYRVSDLTTGNVFDAPRMNIGVVEGGSHCNPALHPGELMQPRIGQSTRRPIRLYPTVALVARAHQYQIPMQFVDPTAAGLQFGTAWEPWQSLPTAMSLAPLDVTLLLAPNVFNVSHNQRFSARRSIVSARGGATIQAP